VNAQHLSDEAVAAFADGVLVGHSRERAAKHVNACAECREAVRVQREAAMALRAAPPPALPAALAARLRSVPQTTPINSLPTVVGPDGSAMLATFGSAAAFVPGPPRTHSGRRAKPIVTTAAVVALAGALTAGSVARQEAGPVQSGTGQVARTVSTQHGTGTTGVTTFDVFRGRRP
jgi:hypothetical protein